MSVNDVKEAVLQISHTADRFGRWLERNNLAMRYAVVDPILWALGWRTWLPQECRPDFQLGNRGRVDYALLDDQQDPAVLIVVGSWHAYRRRDRVRLRNCVRGMTQGVAVLACGQSWEIYDLGIHARPFDDKRVAVLTLNQVSPDAATDGADALHYWISREWWH